jgi:hypothetical protein
MIVTVPGGVAMQSFQIADFEITNGSGDVLLALPAH